MTINEEKTRNYVALIIVDSDKESSFDEVKDSIKAAITENSGKIAEEKFIGKKSCSYHIKKKATGIYYEVSFNAAPSAMPKINRLFNINTSILRALIDVAQ